jgi:hypothetical protein
MAGEHQQSGHGLHGAGGHQQGHRHGGVLPAGAGGAGRRTVDRVDNRAGVRDFLTPRRARITPGRAGIPVAGQRRVPGLRRSEVAAPAGRSVEYRP